MSKEIKIEDYLHYYIPFEFTWIVDAVPFKKGERGTMTADDLKYWDEHKAPLLRPLSDITQEEDGYIFGIQKGIFDHEFERQAMITHYLLSKGFDVFGLIDAGLAIDKTKL